MYYGSSISNNWLHIDRSVVCIVDQLPVGGLTSFHRVHSDQYGARHAHTTHPPHCSSSGQYGVSYL